MSKRKRKKKSKSACDVCLGKGYNDFLVRHTCPWCGGKGTK